MQAEQIEAASLAIQTELSRANWIAIFSHVRPDGDAVGSLLGLGLALRAAGKQVTMVLEDGVPHIFRHLKGSDTVRRSLKQAVDLVITVDCSDIQRAGAVLGEQIPDINIDHHVSNLEFARHNLVIGDSVATCAILAEYLPVWGYTIDLPVAEALLTGNVTDTIGFRTNNVTAQALRLAANLIDVGANLPDLYMRALVNKSYEAARYWGAGLEKLQREDGLVWTTLSLQDRQQAQYPGNDDADLVNLLSSVESTIAVIFVEQKSGQVKVSWRARPGYDVSQIALQFGGGGHTAASGADIAGSLEEVQQQVLEATRAMLASAKRPTH